MSYDPQLVGRYGNLAEVWAAGEYDIELSYPVVNSLKFDAEAGDRPIDVKSSMVNGVRPTFKFWQDQHETLAENDGGYILIWYRAVGEEIEIHESRPIKAERIKITNWTNPGPTHHRSHTKEAQLPADQLRP